MSKRKTKVNVPQVKPTLPPEQVFTKVELQTVLRYIQKRVVISASIRVEQAQDDMNNVLALTQAIKGIEAGLLKEIQGK
jgi:hypothetical protein